MILFRLALFFFFKERRRVPAFRLPKRRDLGSDPHHPRRTRDRLRRRRRRRARVTEVSPSKAASRRAVEAYPPRHETIREKLDCK